MQELYGRSVCDGIAIGRIKLFKKVQIEITDEEIEEVNQEIKRYQVARDKAIQLQNELYEKVSVEAGENSAEVFSVHAMMLEDDDLNEDIISIIKNHKKAEYAVDEACKMQAEVFYSMEDSYMRERGSDIIDIGQCIIEQLSGTTQKETDYNEKRIFIAEDLTPSDTVRLNKKMLLGFITKKGSENSHTAILARNMGIPAIVQCSQMLESYDGSMAIIDGYKSIVYVDPTEEILEKYKIIQRDHIEKTKALTILIGKKTETKDGKNINLYANIGSIEELSLAKKNDAEGIGLFRSEFLYLNSIDYPSEAQQFEAYKEALQEMSPRKVIIRTCDIGADKSVEYMGLEHEDNPALGLRAIRISLSNRDFFKTQLRAILRASAYGNLAIMFPMIISRNELIECKKILEECKRELDFEKVFYSKSIEIGTMIETPAAVFIADDLAKECDFFSIGTNDLTQYICAIDRQNASLEAFSDSHHPAVLKAIELTVEAAHKNNCWVGICGELGSDLSLTEYFIKLGIDELSVNTGMILPIREKNSLTFGLSVVNIFSSFPSPTGL